MADRAAQASANGMASANGAANGHAGHPVMSDALYEMKPNRTNTKELTTNAGQPIIDNDHSLSAGERGPLLLEDMHLQEKLAQFNRERVPERVVHARGMTAKGYFEVTDAIPDLCCADMFSEVGKRTDVTTRFSTVVHERGSPESLRDVRGFSVKHYTKEGNWDLVGNNIPVFFIRDGKKFVDLNHALKPSPVSGIQEGWRVLDFLTHHPEATHVLSWLLDINGIPRNWRALEGHGVNTFTLVNQAGAETLCKFHWLPTGGAQFMDDEEAQATGAENMRHSHATADLVEAIQSGNPPTWGFYIQTMPVADQGNYNFDPLDATKTWPEDEFPLRQIGKLVLDRPITSMFSENEQVAFNPANLIPGIAPSNDKLLQSRLFAYADAQRYRLGVNWQQLPVNAPKFPHHNNHNEGRMQFNVKDEETNYHPSCVEKAGEGYAKQVASVTSEALSGHKVMTDLPKAKSDPQYDFRQAGERWRNEISKDDKRAALFLKHIVAWMSMPKCNDKIRSTWVGYWTQVDAGLGERVKKQLAEALRSS